MSKKNLDVAVLSDIHLGAVGCKAEACLNYLNSINPKILILNGDIIDIWNFRKFYWPASHMAVIKSILEMMNHGTEIYYLTGNHDELLRKLSNLKMGSIHLRDHLVLTIDGKKCWFFHGDIFDLTMKYSKWIAKLGGYGYDLLILLNLVMNKILKALGRNKFSLSKKVKDSVKKAVEFVESFENTAINMAFDEGYDAVFCGHIHKAAKKQIRRGSKIVEYFNSGDWVENLTALEFDGNNWQIFRYDTDFVEQENSKHSTNNVIESATVEFAA